MSTYLVTQATGQQSQWVITHLLAAGAKVHAIVRDSAKKLPEVLQSPGVTIFQGNTENFEEVYKAAQGCVGVFLNTFPIPGLAPRQAQAVVDACKKAGLRSIVSSSTFGTGDKAGWDNDVTKAAGVLGYFTQKAACEDIVRGAGLEAYTILRPAFIHFDFFKPSQRMNFPELAETGELVHFYDDSTRMPYSDASDIGAYAAAALRDPGRFAGQEIDIAGEALTIREVRDVLARVSGRDIPLRRRRPEDLAEAMPRIHGLVFQIRANGRDETAAVAAAREAGAKLGMPFRSLEEALRRDKDRLLESLPALA
ncbi:NmrA-like family protein [Xylariomycetidae sp. FL2044]|nr:NmrA-like family protein [Xylariomycetidae sp. FL2044]